MRGNGKKGDQRQYDKKWKKNGVKKYGQTDYGQSRGGMLSCYTAVFSLLILAGCIVYAFLTKGNAAGFVGGLAVIAFFLSLWGLRNAIGGFKERNRRYLACRIGIPANIFVMLCFLAIFIGGLRG